MFSTLITTTTKSTLLRALIGLCLLITAVSARAADPEALSELYESALEYYYGGDILASEIEVLNLLQAEPGHIGGRILKGQIEIVMGNGAAAQDSFETVQKLGAADELYIGLLAEALIQQGKYKELYRDINTGVRDPALEASVHIAHGKALLAQDRTIEAKARFALAEKLWPQAPEPRVARAMLAMQDKDYVLARELLIQATRMTPEYAQAWFVLGAVENDLRNPAQALDYISIAIERNPYYIVARNARVALLLAADREEEALEDIQFILNIRPQDLQANYRYSLLLARDGDMEAADLVMNRVSKTLESIGTDYVFKHPPSLFLYGLFKFRDGNIKEAKIALNRYLEMEPGDVGASQLMGVIMAREKNHEAVIELLEPIVDLQSNNPQLLALLGQAKMAREQVAEATALFERAVDLAPFNRQVRTQLALTRIAVGQQSRALNELEEILEFDAASANVIATLGVIYLDRGEPETALEWGQRALAREPASESGENLIGAASFSMGLYDEARDSFRRSIAANPNNMVARYNLAELAEKEGKKGEVRQQLEYIATKSGRDIEALARLGRLALEDGDINSAISWFEKLRIEHPNAVVNQLELLEIYLDLGRIQEANWLVEDLSNRFPDNLKVLYALGRTRMAANKTSGAAIAFSRMSLVADFDAEELTRIALLQQKVNDTPGSRRSLQKALEAQPNYLPAMVNLCQMEMKLANTSEALKIAESIQSLYPKVVVGYQMGGNILLRLNRVDEAIAVFESGLSQGPSSGLAASAFLARLRASGEDPVLQQIALKNYKTWVEANPQDIAGRRTYAGALYRLARPEESLEQYRSLLQERPQDAQLHNAIANVYLEVGDARAFDHSQKAYALAPEDPLIMDTYGWVLHKQGEDEQALNYLREATLKRPTISELRYHLGAVLFELGRFREAQLELEAALERSREFDGADAALELLSKIRGA